MLCTEQVREIHFPDSRSRWTQSVLARLRDAGLVESVQPPRTGRRLWFATERGVRMAREAHALEATPRPLEGSEVAGQLQAHTLAVNDAGICFLRAARERDDEFGPLSWRHEVAHRLSRGRGRRRRTLIADAVLTYLRGEGGRVALEQRFLELDRATLSVDRLVAELAAYAELHRAEGGDGEPVWRALLPALPGRPLRARRGSRAALERRRNSVIALLRSNLRVARTREVRISICLLEDLEEQGPFAPIFVEVREPGRRSTGSVRRRRRSGRGTDVPVYEVKLTPSEIDAIVGRVAELLQSRRTACPARPGPRLVTAAEVARWCGVERSWVYAHAEELGARRIGTGERPRLRFDRVEVSERIAALSGSQTGSGRGSTAIAGDAQVARFLADGELLSSGKKKRPGGAQTPPARRRRNELRRDDQPSGDRCPGAAWRPRLPCLRRLGPGGDGMARRSEGQVVERHWKSGRGYALRFRAYGERQYLTLG